MMASAARVQDLFGFNRWISRLLVVAAVGGTAALVLVAMRMGQVERVALVGAFGLAILLFLRWPLVPLYLFVALIPIEFVGIVGDLGTLSRYAGILFAIVYGVPRLGRLTLSAVPLPGWLFFGWALLSITWALDPTVAATALATLVQMFLIMVLVADVVVHRPLIVRPLLWVYSISAAITGVIGIDAYLTGATSTGRVSAFATQDVAQFAAILLPALVFSLSELLRGRVIPISGAIAAITSTGIIVSGTRGAWLSAVVVIALFVIPRMTPRVRIASVGVIALLLIVAFQLPGVSDLVSKRTATAVTTGGAGRTDIWNVGLTIIQTSPVIGVGYGNFPVAFTPEMIAESDVGAYLANDESARGPHSIIFGSIAELGIIGFIPLAMFLVPFVLRRGWGPDGAAVQAALVSVLVSALFLDVLNRKQVWLIIGMAAGLTYLAMRRREIGPAAIPRAGGRPKRPRRIEGPVLLTDAAAPG